MVISKELEKNFIGIIHIEIHISVCYRKKQSHDQLYDIVCSV